MPFSIQSMKRSSSLLLPILLFHVLGSLVPVSAEIAVLTLLNKGYPLESGDECSAEEWELIKSKLAWSDPERRNVRHRLQVAATTKISLDMTTIDAYCTFLCANFAPYHCCLAWSRCDRAYYYRRHRSLGEESTKSSWHRWWSGWLWSDMNPGDLSCSAKKAGIHWTLNSLKYRVGEPCRNLIEAERELTCYDFEPVTAVENAEDSTLSSSANDEQTPVAVQESETAKSAVSSPVSAAEEENDNATSNVSSSDKEVSAATEENDNDGVPANDEENDPGNNKGNRGNNVNKNKREKNKRDNINKDQSGCGKKKKKCSGGK